MSVILVLILVTTLSALICYSIAMKRGADSRYWVIMAILLGPFALPFVVFSKPIKR